jgi:hypothetical protein
MPVDTDLEVDDHIERPLPSGKTQNLVITHIDFLRSPFGSNTLDHLA